MRNVERRRTIRIRRSALLNSDLSDIDRPSIKIAETLDEYRQAFQIVHDQYLMSGYLKTAQEHGMLYGIHSLLPKTCVFIFKTYLSVISTITLIQDTPLFGLPMDSLYKDELDSLRDNGRKVVEISALATPRERRWQNLVIFLAKAIYRYCKYTSIDDMCIMVNPKHVRFYKELLMFEDFGEEKWYDKVDAPAVALRVNFASADKEFEKAYSSNDFDTDLHSFFVKVNNTILDPRLEYPVERNKPMDSYAAKTFLTPKLLDELTPVQREYVEYVYHTAIYNPQLADHVA